MPSRGQRPLLLLAVACGFGLLICLAEEEGGAGPGPCELSVAHGGRLYSFSLASPTPAHRHGILSEDGFYKVAVNDSVLWFQLCDQMIFNFDPPVCLNCEDCGGPLRCGTQCSALVSNNRRDIGIQHFAISAGYDVCTTIGRVSKSHISLIDELNPQKGVVVKMFSSKCSISVYIFCDTTVAQVSTEFVLSGSCDYATTLRHPSGCARSMAASGNGWGWLAISFVTIFCLLGGYILSGAVYRYYFLGIHSVEAIPNLEFWISLPQTIKSMLLPSARSARGRNRQIEDPYAPVDH
ncbi:uncharacterized protein LOC102717143 isoform X1 [Oryza brachyantha]|uniref:uncharacterized protein LOC102717143 isoform X1 n=1 Tax=Oryza brachyantha TaxID=4533 RepID=UPI001AD97F8D|nr:uncharacterized protein LOC102717143 isoform X1 [Oryza brachyantha]XP_040377778.1 uncharacterized protein LOC102717143 isoform X1 [Oryza brachyantha]XP_040377780.1 uncharacterized protein LOC102717143 isoform X1 [Oryza brachyantha]XP_040377781.1 uncharacterized protein LOC102717143 isoform X1 [Oryza brachyantha]XP_040377782.1 uncharacterized protein LOC102717143 isoform X1 [Oryza brachyantha]